MRNQAPKLLLAAVFSITIGTLPWPASALAAAPTRAEYVLRVEPICAAATRANGGALRGVEGMVRRHELRRAAPKVWRAAAALGATLRRLAAVSRPPADADRLDRWLDHGRSGEQLLRRIGHSLEGRDRAGVERSANLALREAKRANAAVVGFGFSYCQLKVGRFV